MNSGGQTMMGNGSKSIYVAGPMTGYPEYNHPAFFAAEERLRELYGYGDVVNPARLDTVTAGELGPGGLEDGSQLPAYLRRDFTELVLCGDLVLLDGWQDSAGANAELAVARWLDLDVWTMYAANWMALAPTDVLPNTGVVIDTWNKFGRLRYLDQRRRYNDAKQEAG